MTERERRRQLKRTGIAAAREARALLAEAIALLDAEVHAPMGGTVLAEQLASAVGELFRAEVAPGPEDVRDRLDLDDLVGPLAEPHEPLGDVAERFSEIFPGGDSGIDGGDSAVRPQIT